MFTLQYSDVRNHRRMDRYIFENDRSQSKSQKIITENINVKVESKQDAEMAFKMDADHAMSAEKMVLFVQNEWPNNN